MIIVGDSGRWLCNLDFLSGDGLAKDLLFHVCLDCALPKLARGDVPSHWLWLGAFNSGSTFERRHRSMRGFFDLGDSKGLGLAGNQRCLRGVRDVFGWSGLGNSSGIGFLGSLECLRLLSRLISALHRR